MSPEPSNFYFQADGVRRPLALINPAISHPEVIVAAVAARDPKKAEAFAKKHNIPIVHKTYDGLSFLTSLSKFYEIQREKVYRVRKRHH